MRKNQVHGMSYSPEYRAWTHMLERCSKTSSKKFKDYGARGISVCAKWRGSFLEFFKDIGKRPSKNHSINRVDNNGNYEPKNVEWATREEQQSNTRRCVYFNWKGERLCRTAFAKKIGLNVQTVRKRIRLGWSLEKIASTKPLEDIPRKLTEKQVREIKKKLSCGFGLTDLGRKYGVCKTAIYLIRTGENWRHVT